MSDFSTVSIATVHPLFPMATNWSTFQSKDFPEHESETACIGGEIRSDGIFVRGDGRWNPDLHGWVQLFESYRETYCCVRFEGGRAVECTVGAMDLSFNGPMAWESPNNWVPVSALVAISSGQK